MKKRWISLALVLCMVLTLLPVSAFAADIVASGECGAQGNNVTWTLDSDGVLTISGAGETKDYSFWGDEIPQSPFYENKSIKKLIINPGVTYVGDFMFCGCRNLTNAALPDGITGIGCASFQSCVNLKKIAIPNGVICIGESAFAGCFSLSNVIMPETLTSIGQAAFIDCHSLTSITIPDRVTNIGPGVFAGCTALSMMKIGKANTVYSVIDNVLFNKAQTTLICYPCSTTGSYQVPNSVVKIEIAAFAYCSNLVSIEIPDSVTKIEYGTFGGCSNLTNVLLPDNLTSIGDRAFLDCLSLTNIKIPNNVTNIGNEAFLGCSSLTAMTIPNNVTSIGDSAFEGCSSLISLNIPDRVARIEDGLLEFCTKLKSVTLPNSITSIGNEAFLGCSSLTSITIPDSVISIGDNAFGSCSSLISLRIPNSVTRIEDGLLKFCTKLNSVALPNSITSIGNEAFYNCNCLTTITIPNSVTSIGSNAFEYCNSLTRVNIPDSVTSIGADMFAYCTSLSNVTIPNSVASIECNMFYNCSSLMSVSIPDSVTSIGNHAFHGCNSLTDVYYSGTQQQWRTMRFDPYNDELLKASLHCNYVSPDGQSVALSFSHTSYHVGYRRTYSIRAETNDAAWYDDSDVTWTSSNEKAVKIRNTHVFTDGVTYLMAEVEGVGDGVSTITLKTSDGRKTSCVVSAGGYEAVTNIYLSMYPSQIMKGETRKINAAVYPIEATNKKLSWSSSDSSIAKVDKNGNVTGIKAGTATIYANSKDGVTESIEIEVHNYKSFNYSDYQYSFINSEENFCSSSSYRMPPERYMQIGYSKFAANKAYKQSLKDDWPGYCYGMSISSLLFYKNILAEEKYDETVHVTRSFSPPNTNSATDARLRGMIELLHLTQRAYSKQFDDDLDFSIDDVISELDRGNPVVLNLIGYHSGKPAVGHSVVTYGYESYDNIYTFKIYDCAGFINYMEYYANSHGTYFALLKDYYIWSLGGYEAYDSILKKYNFLKDNNSNHAAELLSFNPEEMPSTLVNNKNRRSENLQAQNISSSNRTDDLNSTLWLFIPKSDFNIVNADGIGSTVENGAVSGDLQMDLQLPSYLQDQSSYTVMMPAGTYTVSGPDSLSAASEYGGLDIASKDATAVTLSEDLHTVSLDCAADDSFSVNFTVYDNLFDELTVSGIAAGPVEIALAEDHQSAAVKGAASVTASASVSGEVSEVSAASTGEAMTVQCVEAENGTQLQLLAGEEPLSDSVTLADRQQTAVPSYDLESGTYDEGQLLTFEKDDGTLIYYTLDGSEPTEDAGLLYTLPIEITKSVIVKAMAVKYGYTPSEVVTLEYLLPALYPPTASVLPGSYDKVLYVDLNAEEDAQVYYTTDGSDPKENGALFGASIVLEEDATIRTYCVKDGLVSNVISYTYEVSPTYHPLTLIEQPANQTVAVGETALFSVTADGDELTYQWQFRQPGETQWNDSTMNCARSDVLIIPVTDELNGQSFRCQITDAYGNVIVSDAATLTVKAAPPTNPFTDVPDGKFFTDAVLWAVSHDPQITTGVTDTTFMPDRVCTRAHVVTFLWRANGCPEPKSTTNHFKDVPNGKYYTKAVLWASEQGITTGYADGTFRPNDDCTRAQVVTFLWRANGSPNPTNTTNPFKDVSSSAYYFKAVLWALETGVTTGKTPTTFNPDGECTRAHVVTFLYRDLA